MSSYASTIPNLGDMSLNESGIKADSLYSKVLKYCSKERLMYIGIGIILLVCIYFYLKRKWAKEEESENLYLKNDQKQSELSNGMESDEISNNYTPVSPTNNIELDYSNMDNQPESSQNNYEPPDGFVTIPVETYEQLQENFVNNSNNNMSTGMENNLSNEEDLELSKELSDFQEISRLESSDEEDRTKAQDLTNTEIQSIQNQLNSFKTNTNLNM